MKIGLIDVDGHNFTNFALMKVSAHYKRLGHEVEWATPFDEYDHIFASKIFTFSPRVNVLEYRTKEWHFGGTGYDIHSRLPEEIENERMLDYSIYPNHNYSVQFYSRGCIRHCPFCLVHDKEGGIQPVTPHDWNPNGEWIEVLDNNFFANPNWRVAVEDLRKQNKPIKFHGVDVRIMTEEMAKALNSLKLKNGIHIAWDLPKLDLRPQIEALTKWIKPSKIVCYVLVGFNSTREQDLFRLRTLKEYGILPFVQPYRDYTTNRQPTQYEKDIARWANRMWIFNTMDFLDYEPRKGFKCAKYFDAA